MNDEQLFYFTGQTICFSITFGKQLKTYEIYYLDLLNIHPDTITRTAIDQECKCDGCREQEGFKRL